jgi:queuine tRNA-ribosyltransferase
VDLFDCVWPTRAGRFGTALTVNGKLNLLNARFKEDADVIDPGCPCDACASGIPRGTLRAGFQAKELLPSMMVAQHNLYFIQNLMQRIRTSIEGGNFEELRLGIRRVYPLDSDKG